MKRIIHLLLLLSGIHFTQAQGICERDQCYFAEINNQPFQFRDYWPVSASLIKQQGSLDGRRPERTIINIVFSGNSYVDSATGKQFNEGIELEINFEEEKTGEPKVYTVAAQYKSGVYSIIKGQGALVITEIKWEPDRRSFHISADVDCKMYCWGHPVDDNSTINLKAHLTNVLINVPGWLLSRN